MNDDKTILIIIRQYGVHCIRCGYCYRLSSVCMSVTPCKTTESIEMPFGELTQVGPRNHNILDGSQIP